VDSQRRIYIPKEIPFDAETAIIIPQGSSYLLVPVPRKPIEIDVKVSTSDLKRRAEEKAKADAVERAVRRSRL